MFDLTLTKELTELIAINFSFPDIEAIGKYLYKKYSTHELENVNESITISSMNAAKRLVLECEDRDRLNDLFTFIIELDNSLLNGKIVTVTGLENLLYKLSCGGVYYDFSKRKLKSYKNDNKYLENWGTLKEGREYSVTIASLDICGNTDLVIKYKSGIVEEVYFRLWEFIRRKLDQYNGRIWTWAGDGGILAFRNDKGIHTGISCCMEILFSLPVFNSSPLKQIPDEISLRIGMDSGMIKFYNDTGKIVSEVINYASKLEKNATSPNGLSVSDNIYKHLSSAMKRMFTDNTKFNGKTAHSLKYEYSKALS
ncbi:MAG: adenylate/guanylate cyclase domain-containing protein [Spirochaetes bacterium]|nr:adenylate/guanylate cyclase domain-containing protein [Spirochaetota bacterium]